MDTTRRKELADLFAKRLDSETRCESDICRLKWLLEHFDEFLERWVAFCQLDEVDLESSTSNDLYHALIIALDVIDCEVARSCGKEISFEWSGLSSTIRDFGKVGDVQSVGELLNKYFVARNTILDSYM